MPTPQSRFEAEDWNRQMSGAPLTQARGPLCITTVVPTFEDFDPVTGLLVMPIFLFSGIFFPVAQFPGPLQWLIAALPLCHAIELLRALTTGAVSADVIGHIFYLAVVGASALILALRCLERKLVK